MTDLEASYHEGYEAGYHSANEQIRELRAKIEEFKEICRLALVYNQRTVVAEGDYCEQMDMKTKQKLPDGIPAPKEGWEYYGLGPVADRPGQDGDVAVFTGKQWSYTCWVGSSSNVHYALRVGSLIWKANLAPKFEVRKYPGTSIDLGNDNEIIVFGETAALRDHIIKLLNENPLPVAFNWDKLWSELPSWINWVVMSRDGDWFPFMKEPFIKDGRWEVLYEDPDEIPKEHAPPAVADWTKSKVERPGK